MATVKFTNTALVNSGKQGLILPGPDGYREVIVGALNFFNSIGEYYTLKGAQDLFESSSSFKRRIQKGALRGEAGHPRFVPGMSNDEYIRRLMDIDESNVICHFKDIWLDFDRVKDDKGNKVVAVMASVIPAGPKADALERSFNNPNENIAFSVRGITNDQVINRVNNRALTTIITYDYVNEGGISVADKWFAPSMESYNDNPIQLLETSVNAETPIVTVNNIKRIVEETSHNNLATESSLEIGNAILESLGVSTPNLSASFTKW